MALQFNSYIDNIDTGFWEGAKVGVNSGVMIKARSLLRRGRSGAISDMSNRAR